jgi:hypothetical protein
MPDFGINITQLPSNIGGISIPDAVKGPLTALYGPGKYDKATLRYPRDLGSNQARKHSIVFTVKKLDRTNLSSIGDAIVNSGKGVISAGANTEVSFSPEMLTSTEGAIGGFQSGLKKVATAAEPLSGAINSLSSAFVKPNRISGTTIGLYIPDNVNVSYSTEYDDNESLSQNLGRFYFLAQGATSLARAFKDQGDKSLTSMINAAGNDPYVRDAVLTGLGKLTGTNLTRLGLNAAGYAMNPQLQVLFRGIGFRSFQFDFVFTPHNKKEAETVNDIIKTFKYHSAPKITKNGFFDQGYYMEIPETFDINFFYGNEENRNINRIGECVLEQVDVDYAGGGQWATYNDGSPNQIKMSLRFKETIIIDKNRIDQGY